MGAKCSLACDDSGRRNIGYKFFELVGTGGFSKVKFLVILAKIQHNTTFKVWKVQKDGQTSFRALKQMVKYRIMSKNSVDAIINERQILENLDHPFIVNMYSAFQDKYNLYLIMDYLPGGDLRYHIKQTKIFSEQNASYLRLTDFGISRYTKTDNSNETSGTPGYLAPETLMRLNHGKESDYFGLGVVLFEMIKGYVNKVLIHNLSIQADLIQQRPYNVRSRKEMRDKIFEKEIQLEPSDNHGEVSANCIDLINKLIKIKPFKRIGCNGIQEIFSHPWFDGYDWESLRNKTSKDVFFTPKKGMNYSRKPRIETETCEEDRKNKELLSKNEYQLLFKDYDYNIPIKEVSTVNNLNNLSSNEQNPQSSLSQYNHLEDHS
ncbi:hypothetical protein ABPG72_002295 [Tetrahymena utriculariae]